MYFIQRNTQVFDQSMPRKCSFSSKDSRPSFLCSFVGETRLWRGTSRRSISHVSASQLAKLFSPKYYIKYCELYLFNKYADYNCVYI